MFLTYYLTWNNSRPATERKATPGTRVLLAEVAEVEQALEVVSEDGKVDHQRWRVLAEKLPSPTKHHLLAVESLLRDVSYESLTTMIIQYR